MKEYILDRLEGNYAILEDENREFIKINICDIYGNFKEGDVLIKDGEKFTVSEELTNDRKEKIKKMMNNMWWE